MHAPRALLLFATVLWTVSAARGPESAARGGCPGMVDLWKTRIRTATNTEFKIGFGLKNNALASSTDFYVTISVPQGVTYVGSVVKMNKGTGAPQVTPVVTDGVVVWRFPKLPSLARIKFSTKLKVDKYCVPEGGLTFEMNGYRAVNTTVECSTTITKQATVKNSGYCFPPEDVMGLGFATYASGGTDCMEEGTVAPLSFPTTYECYQYCSQSAFPSPWYFRVRTLDYGATECSCVGTTCHAGPTGGPSSTGRRLRYIRDLQANGTVTDTRVYQVTQSAPPTAQPTLAPTGVTVAPTPQPTNFSAQLRSLSIIEDGPNQPLLNVRQLSLGYHSFLGLLPNEQQGVYMRRPIFQLHVDPDYSFAHMQAQLAEPLVFDVPLEYYVAAGAGICNYDASSATDGSIYDTLDFTTVTKKHGIGMAPVKIALSQYKAPEEKDKKDGPSPTPPPAPESNPPPESTPEAEKAKPSVFATYGASIPKSGIDLGSPSAMWGNSRESREARAFGSMGFTSKMQTTVKRPYYTAGLRLDKLVSESFTNEFKQAAYELAEGPYDLAKTVEFINTWGNHVFDSAEMGAMAYVTNYFDGKTSKRTAQKVAEDTKNKNIDFIVSQESSKTTKDDTSSLEETVAEYKRSAVTSIGEYASSSTGTDDCRIGNQLIPQMIGFNLRPLWDVQIPLDLFMDLKSVYQFRNRLKNATETMGERSRDCKDASGNFCAAVNGTCAIDLNSQQNGLYDFTCIIPPSAATESPAESETYDFLIYILKGGGQDHRDTRLESNDIESVVQSLTWTIDDTDTRFLRMQSDKPNHNQLPIRLPGEDRDVKYRIVDSSDSDCSRDFYMSVVVCPIISTPMSRSGEIPDDMCYRIYWGCFRYPRSKGANDYYRIDFSLNTNSRIPNPRDVSFKVLNEELVKNNIQSQGGPITMDPTKTDWNYPVHKLLRAIEDTPFPYGNGNGLPGYGSARVRRYTDGPGRCTAENLI